MKKIQLLIVDPSASVFANDSDAYIPEIWAQEGLMILENNMVAGNLVHRDFSDEIQMFGDVVNTRRPNDFVGKRKTDADNVTIQDAIATNVAVPLDQHIHTSFIIKDGEESKSFKNLVEEYLRPAVISLAQMIDEVVLAQTYRFLSNHVGTLGSDPTVSDLVDLNELMHTNKVPVGDRRLVMPPAIEGAFLKIDQFTSANRVGDDGSALANASLGRKYGFDMFMDQNTPSVAGTLDTEANAVNNIAGYPAGATSIAYDGLGTPAVGEWAVIAGDDTPQLISAVGGGSITIGPGLASAVVDDAVITTYKAAAVDNAAGYAVKYAKEITIDGVTNSPKTGQLVSIGADIYAALSTPTATSLLLDRPLEAAVADDDVIGLGPAGNYAFAFSRNALALVTRPLAQPAAANVSSAVASFNGLSLRIVMTYDGDKQGTLVTVDLLAGVQVLDERLGAVLFG